MSGSCTVYSSLPYSPFATQDSGDASASDCNNVCAGDSYDHYGLYASSVSTTGVMCLCADSPASSYGSSTECSACPIRAFSGYTCGSFGTSIYWYQVDSTSSSDSSTSSSGSSSSSSSSSSTSMSTIIGTVVAIVVIVGAFCGRYLHVANIKRNLQKQSDELVKLTSGIRYNNPGAATTAVFIAPPAFNNQIDASIPEYKRRQDKYDFFISYRQKFDSATASDIALNLRSDMRPDKARRFTVFLDTNEINIGMKWKDTFEGALLVSTVVIPLLSVETIEALVVTKKGVSNPFAFLSVSAQNAPDNVLLEWDVALQRQDRGEVVIIPMVIGDFSRVFTASKSLSTAKRPELTLTAKDIVAKLLETQVVRVERDDRASINAGCLEIKQTLLRLFADSASVSSGSVRGHGNGSISDAPPAYGNVLSPPGAAAQYARASEAKQHNIFSL
ncbi:hypothetical protein HK100_007710 [Physocladia obscura]|uniref:TIR domain-containing protein n=1 Tax=Physocladia obscura TaxID=109957 RepID=A0AAD5SUM4_9FUNG|nr:hypothetical protein HK100_007710 [Physocladia obscura]